MTSEGYEMVISIRLSGIWKEMNIDQLVNFNGEVFGIRLKFNFNPNIAPYNIYIFIK
jgi:hypothetical protein